MVIKYTSRYILMSKEEALMDFRINFAASDIRVKEICP